MEHRELSTGLEVTLKRRWGGHGGIATEWEIHTAHDALKEVIRRLPNLSPIQHSTHEHLDYHANWIILPEGVSVEDAGKVAGLLASALWDEKDLLKTLYSLQMKYKDKVGGQVISPNTFEFVKKHLLSHIQAVYDDPTICQENNERLEDAVAKEIHRLQNIAKDVFSDEWDAIIQTLMDENEIHLFEVERIATLLKDSSYTKR